MKEKYFLLSRLYDYNKKSFIYAFRVDNKLIKIYAGDYITALNILKGGKHE